MATVVYFNGKREILPGVYSTIKSGVNNPPQSSDFSKVLVIDTGSQANYGGGSGINGQHVDGQDAIYQFSDLNTYREFLKGGILWKAAEGLFKPDGGAPGASVVYHVKAATTTKSSMTFTATGGGSNGGNIVISPRDEGVIGNGLLDSGNDDNLYKGYAYSVESGVKDTSKWIMKLYRGSYTGLYSGDSISYDGIALANSLPILLAQSPEFNNVQELIDWANNNANFGEYFILVSSQVNGTGVVDSSDIAALDDYNVASGGTETYGASDLTDALEAVTDLEYTHILCDRYEETAGAAQVETITFPATTGATQGDYVLLTNWQGQTVALWLDIDGNGTAPTGANYVGANYKVEVDIATGDTAAAVGTKAYAALVASVWATQVTSVNNGDGTVTITQGREADIADAVPKSTDDSGVGSITANTDTDGADGTSTYNGSVVGAIVSHIETDAKYDKYMFFGGGKDKTKFTQTGGSIAMAAYFNTNRVLVVHGRPKLSSNLTSTGFRNWPTIVKAAYACGRTAGLEPQVPATNKSLGIDGEVHNLSPLEQEQALEAGLWVTKFDPDFNEFVTIQDINTLQNNENLVNPDGKSFEHQIERIKAQLNKDLVINAKIQLLGQPNGVNRNTLSESYVKNWTEGFLETKKATESDDNIILSYQDVTVTRNQDTFNVTYGFVPNGPINKLLFTGFILD